MCAECFGMAAAVAYVLSEKRAFGVQKFTSTAEFFASTAEISKRLADFACKHFRFLAAGAGIPEMPLSACWMPSGSPFEASAALRKSTKKTLMPTG